MPIRSFARRAGVFQLGASLAVLSCCGVAAAQTSAPPAAQAKPDNDSGLADIVVTAQRRSEPAQRVPIAVTAFNSAQLARANVTSTADLPSVIPGLTVFPTGGRSPFTLRGVGNNSLSTSPSVLTFIDGVYQPFDGSALDFSNIRSIEVEKGPQGTLFGRNATGGVIQINTLDPGQDPVGNFEVGYGNYNTLSGKAYVAGGIAKNLSADIAGFYYDQMDGWGKNVTTGHDVYKNKRWGLRSKWIATLSDAVTAKFTADYSDRRGSIGAADIPTVSRGYFYDYVTSTIHTLYANKFDIAANEDPSWRVREGGAAFTLEGHFGGIKASTITSYRRAREEYSIDFDAAPEYFINSSNIYRRQAFTQELQLASDTHGPFTWVTGLYYYQQRSKLEPLDVTGIGATLFFQAPLGGNYDVFSNDSTKAYAGYAQGTALVLPDTHLTLGARYTVEKRQLTGYDAIGPSATTGTALPGSFGVEKATFRKPNFRVAIDHNFAPDVLGYVSWNRGFNAGFFNVISTAGYTPAANPLVLPEGIDAYEVGLKSEFLDHRVRVNAAAFLYNYRNLQTAVYTPFGPVTINAASARIKGVDFDLLVRPVRELTLSFNATYLDSKYLSYQDAVLFQTFPNGAFAATGGVDAAGKELINAPKWGLQAAATYTVKTDIGSFATSGDVNYQSKIYSDPFNQIPIPSRTLVGLNEEWTSIDGRLTVQAWVKNLTNHIYDTAYALLTPVGPLGNRGAPRTFGVTIGAKFGGSK